MTYRKTKLMRQVEDQTGQPLERLLPNMINEIGMTQAAQELGISKATIGYWMLKMGIHVERVAVMPGDQLVVKRTA